ncbi:class II aldolase/adducin family protein [Pseudomaricurvus alkylphenolicus]|uniref:class II aldolase/adducin family protein n=1 Tax=Pseudomaricurvus alkylphenolicus TaxID=1306991 RepID=UPI00141F9F03|nr:class II aldolase/adducin family protein [Pseudomaricurvus alkylphenolicus]NIB40360.1 class II aldolase/adducin family protein [Pseudomaricurvus alkylphenolicus]
MTSSIQQDLQRTTIGNHNANSTPGMSLPPQSFASATEERIYIKQRLAGAFRIFGHLQFDEGVAGHISVRDPELRDHFWVNPVGMHFSLIKASDLVLVNHDGEIVEGNALVNTAAFAIHSRLHAHRQDVNAVAHSHSPYGRAFSALGKELAPISQDACMFYGNQAVYKTFQGVVEDTTEGDEIATAMGDKPAAILQNHGILTVGASVDTAVGLFMAMESACRSQLLAEAAGTPIEVDLDTALKTREYNATELVKWANFQPMYQLMLHRDPSFLD